MYNYAINAPQVPLGVILSVLKVAFSCDYMPREESHVPAVCSYRLSDIFADLLDFAAKFLVLGGRLVYWLPVVKHE